MSTVEELYDSSRRPVYDSLGNTLDVREFLVTLDLPTDNPLEASGLQPGVVGNHPWLPDLELDRLEVSQRFSPLQYKVRALYSSNGAFVVLNPPTRDKRFRAWELSFKSIPVEIPVFFRRRLTQSNPQATAVGKYLYDRQDFKTNLKVLISQRTVVVSQFGPVQRDIIDELNGKWFTLSGANTTDPRYLHQLTGADVRNTEKNLWEIRYTFEHEGSIGALSTSAQTTGGPDDPPPGGDDALYPRVILPTFLRPPWHIYKVTHDQEDLGTPVLPRIGLASRYTAADIDNLLPRHLPGQPLDN